MRILIADDEAPARARLRQLLASYPDVEIIGEAIGSQFQVVHSLEEAHKIVGVHREDFTQCLIWPCEWVSRQSPILPGQP
jgi:DNA-binding NarL/FixJ family response regulator